MACPGVVPFKGRNLVGGDGSLPEIEVLDTQAHGAHQAQAAAIHDLRAQFPGIFQACENGADFLAGHDDGWAPLTTGGCEVIQSEVLDAEDVFDEEDHDIEGLVLGGWGDVSFEGEEVEVSGDGGGSGSIRGLAESLETEADEAAIPVNLKYARVRSGYWCQGALVQDSAQRTY
jgi:hypothetical protein